MDSNIKNTQQYIEKLSAALLAVDSDLIDAIITILCDAYDRQAAVYVFGNGGSAALASHMACDLGKGINYGLTPKRMKVTSLVDNVPLLSAWANDVGYESVFASQLRGWCGNADVLFAISGSGNSSNVLRALEYGKSVGTRNIGLTGFAGGKMKALCDECLVVPSDNMQLIEDVHLMASHAIATLLRCHIAEYAGSTQVARAASGIGT